MRELEARSEQELAVAVQQCYRHVFYPPRHRIGASGADLAHSAIDVHSTSDRSSVGQQQVVRVLRDLGKLRLPKDEPDSPAYVRDRTPLKKGQIATRALRDEFRRDPELPILSSDDVFVRRVRCGIEQGEYVYRRGDLLFGPGDPPAGIAIDEQSVVFTMTYAKNKGVWPRSKPAPPAPGGEGADPSDRPPEESPPSKPTEYPPAERERVSFSAEGLLKEALMRLWKQVRAGGVDQIGVLAIRLFEARDASRLLGAVGAVSGANKTVTFEGGYETRNGGSFEPEFRGPVVDA